MDPLLLAIYIVVIITIIVTIQCARKGREILAQKEALTPEECGITGTVKLPYNPLDRFDFYPGKNSVYANIDTLKTGDAVSSNLDTRHRYLAERCDSFAGCVAFTSGGEFKSGVLDPDLRQNKKYDLPCTSNTCGLFVRKCARSEPRYVELYGEDNYGTSKKPRLLLPPGNYPNIETAHIAEGAIGGKIVNDGVKSMKVPPSLKTTLFTNQKYGDVSKTFYDGNYPKLNDHPTGKKTIDKLWGNAVTSLKVERNV